MKSTFPWNNRCAESKDNAGGDRPHPGEIPVISNKEGGRQEDLLKFSCETSPAVKARSCKNLIQSHWQYPCHKTPTPGQVFWHWWQEDQANFVHWSSIGCCSSLILHNLISFPRSRSQYPLQPWHWQPQCLEILTISLWPSLSFSRFLAEINMKFWTLVLPNPWHAGSALCLLSILFAHGLSFATVDFSHCIVHIRHFQTS